MERCFMFQWGFCFSDGDGIGFSGGGGGGWGGGGGCLKKNRKMGVDTPNAPAPLKETLI